MSERERYREKARERVSESDIEGGGGNDKYR